ncbi:MAG: C13 family peptidase [Candidatus Hodarchaeota archaeon]
MDLKKNAKKYIPLLAFIIGIVLVLSLWIIYLPTMRREPIPGARKAIILCSANDFYRKDSQPDFNDGDDSTFSNETGRWPSFEDFPNGYIVTDANIPGYHTPGVVQFIAKPWGGYVDMELVYNWTKYYPLIKSAAYNLSAWVNITTNINFPPINPAIILPGTGAGARIGLRWLNSSNDVIRTDWSDGTLGGFIGWKSLNSTGIADNSTQNEITQLHLVLAVEGNMTGGDMVLFDDVKIEYWFPPPIPSPLPSNIDSDGFPAQALQVYWILKNHGYTDDDIFLMLYHTDDNTIDIKANDGISNDLAGAIIDVENDDVNSSRFKQELNVSVIGSFASKINSKDQLIIYMVDHGSNRVLGDGNATFHFEADSNYITEIEFFNLVKEINCRRILINIDICYSGNFLNQNSSIGLSWYNIPNSILITSTTDIFSWYWRDNLNADGFAGSWFFHQFWDQLNKSETIETAFNNAKNFIPSGLGMSVNDIQAPLIQDNLGINKTWGFNGNPQL